MAPHYKQLNMLKFKYLFGYKSIQLSYEAFNNLMSLDIDYYYLDKIRH